MSRCRTCFLRISSLYAHFLSPLSPSLSLSPSLFLSLPRPLPLAYTCNVELLMPLTARGVNGGAAATASATAAAQSTKKAERECAPEKGAHKQDSERVTHPASTSSSTMTSAKTASTRGTATGAAAAAHDACMQGTRASEAHAASLDAVSAHAPVDGQQVDALHLISQVSPHIPHPGGQRISCRNL